MPVDFTPLFTEHREKIFGELHQYNNLAGVVAVETSYPIQRINFGDTIYTERRPNATTVTRSPSPAIDEYPAVGATDPNERNEMKIDQVIGGYGNSMLRGESATGIERMANEEVRKEVVRIVTSAVQKCSSDLNNKLAAGILPEIGMAIGSPAEELFQDVLPTEIYGGEPWKRQGVYQHANNVLNYYGNEESGRLVHLSDTQRIRYAGSSWAADFNRAGTGFSTARNGAPPVNTWGFADYRQIKTVQSITTSTPVSFGYADENTDATATLAATPAVRSFSISVTAGAVALDLKAGDVLYFTPTASPLDSAQINRRQGYVVAADKAIGIGLTDTVTLTRSIRYDPEGPANVADIKAGWYLRGITSHSAGFALHRDAVSMTLVDPYGTNVEAQYGGSPHGSGAGPVLFVGTIMDKPISQGGTGLKFWMRVLVGTEGWIVEVSAWAGWKVDRPESIMRIVTPPVA